MNDHHTAKLPARPSIAEAAEHFGVSGMTVRRWIAAGRLSAHRVGPRLIRLDRDELLSFGRRIGGSV
ncbi:excisionase family DNA-binding protein [[Mycobacterium] crassicus]|uniref:Excisionase family DNA-binding protein n=1 Tax=[Mycobacterium] crassicus TaxID=2872309 RepID=A0ABU5XNR8_9MYCO|nr:excisionase family DNA-binding protein [Mycolicibacter sp. MYC098]MEB3023925.1 excisionase family DNA-binding protein [Mycolicibacter sp. MYC098]